jgi:hypothetical protein
VGRCVDADAGALHAKMLAALQAGPGRAAVSRSSSATANGRPAGAL